MKLNENSWYCFAQTNDHNKMIKPIGGYMFNDQDDLDEYASHFYCSWEAKNQEPEKAKW